MNNYKEFQTFPDLEQASEMIELLEKNNISFQVDDSATRFQVVALGETPVNKVSLLIEETNFDKVNKLLGDNSSEEDHYLYTFSDKDIIDVIANPTEWTAQEQTIAQKIVKQRNLKISAEEIKSSRSENLTDKITQTLEIDKFYKSIASWYNTIGIFSIINTIGIALKWKVSFLLGLGITQIIDGFFQGLFGQFFVITGLVSFMFASIFFIFGFLSKKKNHSVIVAGIVIYGLDTLIMFLLKFWLGFGFHIFIMLLLISSYDKILKEKKKNEA